MLTIKAEIKKNEQKTDGTYNVKLRFTLNRKVKRLSTSLFVKPTDLTRTGNFKKGTLISKEIDKLVNAYQLKCDSMQILCGVVLRKNGTGSGECLYGALRCSGEAVLSGGRSVCRLLLSAAEADIR